MNISGLKASQGSRAQNSEETSSSSVNAPQQQLGAGRRLQRQDALPTNTRYSASQASSSPQSARATQRYESGASSSGTQGKGHTEGSVPLSSTLLLRQGGRREHPELTSFHDMMLNSPKISRADAIPEQPEIVPKRLQEKMEAINLPQLKKLDNTLHEYGVMVCQQAKQGDGTNSAINKMDIKALPLLAEAENARNPGLNLHVFKNGNECYQAIKEQYKHVQQHKQPLTMRAIYPPFKGMPDHHIALDIQLRPGHRPSIVGFESALPMMMQPAEQLITSALRGARVQMKGNFIQNSTFDCVMFALNNALKAFKHHDEYTARLHKGEKNVPVPATFLKHAQSKTLVQAHPEQNTIVTKDIRGLHAETLLHRNLAYRAERSSNQYSSSIEGFRMQEIQRAGEFLAARRGRR